MLDTVHETCHVMEPYVNDLFDDSSTSLASRHYKNGWIAEFQCYTCHTTYGAHGTFEGKRDGFRHWFLYVTRSWSVGLGVFLGMPVLVLGVVLYVVAVIRDLRYRKVLEDD